MEKPLAIVSEGMKSQFSSYYYMLIKCFNLYRINKMENDRDLTHFNNLNSEVFRLLGIQLHFHSFDKNIDTLIREKIKLKQPVLVFGNMRELYYSNHYKKLDWIHLFLINGYDEERDIYSILDNTQKKNESHKLDEFILTAEMMRTLAFSSKETFGTTSVLSCERVQQHSDSVYLELLILCLKEIQDAPVENNEIVLMEFFQNGSEFHHMTVESLGFQLIRMNNFKEVLFTELINQLKRYLSDSAILTELEHLAKKLIQQWQSAINLFLVYYYRKGSTIDVRKLAGDAIETELSIKKLCSESLSLLYFNLQQQRHDKSESLWNEENNQDLVISLNDKSVVFQFEADLEFDFADCPKIFYKSPSVDFQNLLFKTKLTVHNPPRSAPFQAGIVFRTIDGETYIWGVFKNEQLVLSKTMDPLFSANIESKVAFLQLKYENHSYVFSYGDQNGVIRDAFKTDQIAEIDEIGFGSRNWGELKPMKLEFTLVN
ncbi:hypothetical protein [Cohnella faecalis]|uniref:hypothetical protein n=1 Tax=Cohnella faecalis TaxID=2315694 RepID=UPI0011C235EB|nr:hypothetical protein [Cohnella faecalis]